MIQFHTPSPLGLVRKYPRREKKDSHEDSISGGFNPFSVSLMLGTLSEQSEEKLKESGTTRDAAIGVRRHVSPLRGK